MDSGNDAGIKLLVYIIAFMVDIGLAAWVWSSPRTKPEQRTLWTFAVFFFGIPGVILWAILNPTLPQGQAPSGLPSADGSGSAAVANAEPSTINAQGWAIIIGVIVVSIVAGVILYHFEYPSSAPVHTSATIYRHSTLG